MKACVSILLAAVTIMLTVPTRADAQTDVKQSRYQIGQMERVLEGAVEHGAKEIRDRLVKLLPNEMTLLTDNARVRGFRLEGYGVFFDVVVPSMLETLPWSLRTLDQNNLGLDSALDAIRAAVRSNGNPDLQQALARIELQLGPAAVAPRAVTTAAGARNATGAAAATTAEETAKSADVDSVLGNPEEAYRTEVKQALMDAMLDHSASLEIGPTEWLTVAARRSDDRARLAPADSDAQTVVIRVRGSDLTAFLARQISREDALKRIEVRVF
jgi:hypothetical protein